MIFSKEISESLTYQFAQAANEMKAQGKEIISLGLGEPDFATPDYLVDAVSKAIKDGFTHYSPSQGLPELRKLIANSASKEFGSEYSLQNIIVTPGIKAAVYFALCSLLEPGDEVIVLSPYYVSYPAMIKLAEPQATIRKVSLRSDFSFDMESLERAISPKTKCLLMNSPNNPTGTVLSPAEVHRISELALQHGFFIISDEVYEKLVYGGVQQKSFGEEPEIRDQVIICNGYSKSHAMTGWRLGYAIGPAEYIAKMNKLQQHINTNTCTFVQKAACEIYHNEPLHLSPYVEELERRVNYFDSEINKLPFISGVKPSAGFFYFADISKTGMDSNAFCVKLLKTTGIASTPGIAFGSEWDHYVRFSLAVPMETLERAISLMKDFSRSLATEKEE